MSPHELDRAATMLAETTMPGKRCRDSEVAKKYGMSRRTVVRYRAALGENAELARLVAEKLRLLEAQWLADVPKALLAAVDFLTRAASEGDVKNPDMVEAVATAFQKLVDAKAVNDMIHARIAGAAQAPRSADRPVVAGGSASAPVH